MDHLETAREHLAYMDKKSNDYIGLAIAHALIALVERLDKLMATDKDNNKAIRVVEGRK